MEISFKNFFKEIKTVLPEIHVDKHQTFKNLTTFKIGGRIKAYIEITSVASLLKAISLCKKHRLEYFILGNGSNLLVSDKVFNKVVIKISLREIRTQGTKIICGSGVSLFSLNHFAQKMGLSGLEWSYGIPGSVGGAVKMNSGSYGSDIGQVVETVFYTDGEKIFRKNAQSLKFTYRHSFFSDKKFVILKVVFSLSPDSPENIECKNNEFFQRRLASQPYGTFNAGSIFKKPPRNYAPVLIEMCQLKGVRNKNALISPKHCGFIINENGKATFLQVYQLITKIKKTVCEKFGIILETEVEILM